MKNAFVRALQSLMMTGGLLLSSGVLVVPAMAAPITYNFSGDISGSAPPAIVSGSFTVNPTDNNPAPNIGTYNVQNFQFAVNGNFLQTTGNLGVVNITNGTGAPGGAFDIFAVSLNGPAGYNFTLIGPSNLFTDTALPNPVPSLSSFSANNNFIFSVSGFPSSFGPVTALTAVPLSSAVILFGVGLVALIGFGAGGLRNVRTS